MTANGENGSSDLARQALERILGDENITIAVNRIVDGRPGSELAMNVLREIRSERAVRLAHHIYRTSHGERASTAVWLIKHVAHPCAVPWIEEFLGDPKVAGWGVGVLDQLLWGDHVEREEVEHLIVLAEQHASENVREAAALIREYLRRRVTERVSAG